jgi:hypothetical protein
MQRWNNPKGVLSFGNNVFMDWLVGWGVTGLLG